MRSRKLVSEFVARSKLISLLVIAGILMFSCATMQYTPKTKDVTISKGRPADDENRFIAIPPNSSEFVSMSKEIQKALKKYPKDFLISHVHYVVLYRSMTSVSYFDDDDLEFAGTIGHKYVYVTLRDGLGYVENVFHHEFNHILADDHYELFDREGWENLNPPDFRYEGRYTSYVYVVEHGTSQPWFDTTFLPQGFLSEYSKTTLIEDFARYAEALFMSEKEFWDAYDKYEKVRGKADLCIEFYNKLHPIFTGAYFRDLRIEQEDEFEE
jgi:hypothetical protein